MTPTLLRKVSRIGTGFYTKAPGLGADRRCARFVSKLEKSFNELIWHPSSSARASLCSRTKSYRDGETPIDQLNELEFVDGEIFANVWQTDRIARISPQSGKVVGWIDLKGLLSPIYRLEPGAVLNGIAYDSTRKRLFVTGKLWPSVFEIQLVPKHPK
jgi:hypothetical protein